MLCAHIAYTHVPAPNTCPTGALQWTAILLAGNTPTPPATSRQNSTGMGKGKEKDSAHFKLACSVLKAGAVLRLTHHHSMSMPSCPSSPLNTFLYSHHSAPSAPLSTLIPLFRLPQCSSYHPQTCTNRVQRITAFGGVYETPLWFLERSSTVGGGLGS